MQFINALIYGLSGIAATMLTLDMFLHFTVQKTLARKFIAVLFFVPTAFVAISAFNILVQ